MTVRPPTKYVQFSLRMRESLRAKIETAAKARRTSMNTEIVAMLEQSLQETAILDRIEATVAKALARRPS